LAGYKDKSPSEKAEMTKKEDYYLTLLWKMYALRLEAKLT